MSAIKRTTLFLILLLLILSNALYAKSISSEEKKIFIKHLSFVVNKNYLYSDVATEITDHINNMFSKGEFKKHVDYKSFASAITKELRSVNGDLHFSVKEILSNHTVSPLNNLLNEKITTNAKSRLEFNGFKSVSNLDNGIGYLAMSVFRNSGRSDIDKIMALLRYSDAIILDFRGHRGGTTEMVQYLLSYFFNEPFHMSDTHNKKGFVSSVYSLSKVNGVKRPNVPLFILVDGKTASGAEAFAYVMKNKKRATIIGETTIGAAHSGGTWYLDGFRVFIPNEKHVSPITGTSWEKVGVKPNLEVVTSTSYKEAMALATKSAKKHAISRLTKQKNLITNLLSQLTKFNTTKLPKDSQKVIQQISELYSMALITQDDVNTMGYHFMSTQQLDVAKVVFYTNTLLNPDSANVFDSYAEALEANGNFEESMTYYQKAVDLATNNKSSNLDVHKKSLLRVKNKIQKLEDAKKTLH